MNVYCYTRISTPDQNPELQLRELRDYATRQGWELADADQDVGSGSNACRPGLHRLMEDARKGGFKAVLVWKLDWSRIRQLLSRCIHEEAAGDRAVYSVNPKVVSELAVRCIYVEQGRSSRKGSKSSPLFQQMKKDAALRQFDRLLVWKVSRLARAKPQHAGSHLHRS